MPTEIIPPPKHGSLTLDYDSSLEAPAPEQTAIVVDQAPRSAYLRAIQQIFSIRNRKKLFIINGLILAPIIVIGIISYLITGGSLLSSNTTNTHKPIVYSNTTIPVKNISPNQQLQLGEANKLAINGQVTIGNTLVLAPTATPSSPVTGQFYYNQANNTPYYYNGTQFVSLTPAAQGVTSLGGSSGTIGLGTGLQVTNNQLNALLQAGNGIAVSGSTVTNTGVVTLTSAAPSIVISQDSNGNYTINTASSMVGTGTAGQIAYFTGAQTLGNSILSQSGTTVTVAGSFNVTGATSASSLSIGSNNLTVDSSGNLITAGSLTVSGSVSADTIQQNVANILTIGSIAPSDSLTFNSNGRSFIFPSTGTGAQTICTTGITCASGGGQAVLLQPGSAMTDSGAGTSIWINNTGGGNLLELAGSGVDHFVVSNAGNVTAAGTLAVQGGGGLTVGVAGSVIGSLNLANSTNTNEVVVRGSAPSGSGNATISIPTIAGGTSDTLCLNTLRNCSAVGAAGGDLTGNYPNPTIAKLQGTTLTIGALSSGQVLQYNGSAFVNALIANANLQAGTFSNITGTGALSAGSIASGFGTISTANNITTSTTLQGSIVNATTGFEIGGAATTGHYLRGNGTNYVDSALLSTDISGTLFTLHATSGANQTVSSGATLSVLAGASNNLTTTTSATDNITVDIVSNPTFTGGLTLGLTGTTTGSIAFKGSTGASGTLTLIGPSNPSTNTLTLPNETGTLCSTGSVCSGYAPSTGGNYIAKNTNDTSSASFVGNLLGLTNTNTGAAGVLSLTNNGTNSALNVLQSGTSEPGAGQALILANNNTTTPTGNLLDLQNKGASEFHVDVGGAVTANGNITTTATVQGGTVVATGALQGNSLSINSGTFAVNSAGAITAATGITTSGSIQFSSLGCNIIYAGCVLIPDTSGNLTAGPAVLGTNTTGQYVAGLNGHGGAITLDNSSYAANHITINNALADGATKGIATFSSTDFNTTGGAGVIDTIQSIATTASPTFQALTLQASTTALSLTGTPVAGTGITSLIQVGSAISGGNSAANGGTYLGINEPSSGAGSAADFLNLQNNGTSELKVTSAGVVSLQAGTGTGALNIGTNSSTTSAGGIYFGADTNLYRSAANTLTTNGSLAVGGTGSTNSSTEFQVQNAAGVTTLSSGTATSLVSPTSPTIAALTTGGTVAIGTYYFALAATNGIGTTTAVTSTPASVTTTTGTSSITINWSAVTGATGYQLYYSINGTTWTASSAGLSSATTSYTYTTPGVFGNNIPGGVLPTINTTAGNLNVNGNYQIGGLAVIQTPTPGTLFLGPSAGNTTLSGNGDVGTGLFSLSSLTTGSDNSGYGYGALNAVQTGNGDVGVGFLAGNKVTGSYDVAVGGQALQFTTSATGDVGLGAFSLYNNTTGGSNIGLGQNAGGSPANALGNTTGSNNIYIGANTENTTNATTNPITFSTAIGTDSTVGSSSTISLGCVNGVDSCAKTTSVGIGTSYAPNELTVAPGSYSTGTIEQDNGTHTCPGNSGTAIVGSGTTFTPGMVGGTIYYSDGTSGTITAFGSTTTLTSSLSKCVAAGSTYTIVYGGFNVTNSGTAFLQPTADSTTAFQIQNAANTTTVLNVDTTNGRIGIGKNNPQYPLDVSGNAEIGSWLGVGTTPVDPLIVQNNTSSQLAVFNQQGTGNIVSLQDNGTMVAQVTNTGNAVFRSTSSTTAFQVQTAGGTQLLSVDNSTSANLLSNGGFEVNTNGWSSKGSATISKDTSNAYEGNNSLLITTTATAGDGASFPVTLSANTQYTLSLVYKSSTTTASSFVIGRQDISGTDVNCVTGSLFTNWVRTTCTFTTGGTITSSNIYVQQTDATARSIWIDAVQLQTGSAAGPYQIGQLQLDGVINSPVAVKTTQASTRAFAIYNSGATVTDFSVDNFNNRIGIDVAGNPQNTFEINTPATTDALAQVMIGTGAVGNKGVVIQGLASQTADLFEVQNSSGTVLSKFDANGILGGANGSGTNIAGSNLTIAGGQGTGTANGGNINLQISTPAGGGGSSLNALSTVMSLNGSNGAALFENSANSVTAFQIQNSTAGVLFNADTSNTRIGIGNAAPSYSLDVTGDVNASSTLKVGGVTVCTSAGCTAAANSGTWIQNGTTSQLANFNIQSSAVGNVGAIIEGASGQTADLLDLENGSGTKVLTVGSTGSALVKPSTNSTTAFQIQNASAANILNIDTTTTNNLVTNGDFEADGTTGWAAKGSTTLSQVTTQAWQGNGSLQVATTTAVGDGAQYAFTFGATTQYTLSLYAKVSSGSITDVSIGRQDNGSDLDCLAAQTLTTNWTRFACTFTTGGTISGSNIYIKKTGASAETFFVDGVQLQTGSSSNAAFNPGGAIQLNGIVNSPVAFKNANNSTTAFRIQNSSGGNALNVDTVNGNFSITDSTQVTTTANNALTVQNSATAAQLIRADTTILNIDTNGSFENSSTTATGYATNHAGVTLTVDTTSSNAYIGLNTGKVVTTASAVANSGIKYNLTTATLPSSTSYILTFFAKLVPGQSSFTTLVAGRADDGATETTCSLNSTTLTNYWQRYSCSFNTGTTSGTPYIFFGQSDAGVAHSYYLDGVQLESGNIPDNYREGKLQLNGDIISPTVFRPQSDSTSAFQIQNAGSITTLLNADTATTKLSVTGQLAVTGGLSTAGLTVPAAPTVTPTGGTASTNYSYTITALNANGGSTLASAVGSTSTGVAFGSLGGGVYNQVTWNSVPGASSYNVYRTVGGTTQGLVGNVLGTSVLSFNDTGIAGGAVSTTVDNSGQFVATGTALFQNAANSVTSFQVQNTAGANIINIDTATTPNLITNGDFEGAGSTGWSTKGASTLSQVTTQAWQGNNSLQVATTTAASDGAKYAYTFGATTQYTLSLFAKVAAGSITDVNIGRQDNGSDIDCLTGKTVTTTWTKFNCTFTTGGTISGSNIYIKKTGVVAETIFIDGVQLQTGATASGFNPGGGIQLNGVVESPVTFQNTTNSTNAFQIQNAAGTSLLTINTSASTLTTAGTLAVNGGTAASSGAELMTGSESFPVTAGWTAISGTGTSSTATHTAGGGITALSPTPALTITALKLYQISFTITGSPTAGESITPSIGGSAGSPIYGNDAAEVQVIQAGNTSNLAFTPTNNWNGTISNVSVKLITAATSGLSVGGTPFLGNSNINLYIGFQAGQVSQGGLGDIGLGPFALSSNTSGQSNDAVGYGALAASTTSSNNTAMGEDALWLNTTGGNNTALGYYAGASSINANANITGSNDTFIGYDSGPGSTTQLQNSAAIGTYSVVNENNALVLGCINGTNGCTANTEVGIDTSTPGNLLSIGALTTAAGTYQVAVSTNGTTNSGIVVQTVASQSSGYILQAQDSTGAVLASIDYQGNLSVKAATINGNLTVNGHIITANNSGSTTVAVQTPLGTTGACSLSPVNYSAGNDTSGTITLIPGGTGIANGVQCIITFSSAYAKYPHVVLTPADAASQALGIYGGATANSTFNIGLANAGTSGITYTFNYFIAQ